MARRPGQAAGGRARAGSGRWHAEWEGLIFRAYGWAPATLDGLPALEVYDHVVLIVQSHGADRVWQLRLAAYPHMTKRRDRRRVEQDARQLAEFGERLVPLLEREGLPDSHKLRLIASAIVHGGDTWMRRHAAEMEWLRQQGLSPEQAAAQHRLWQQERSEVLSRSTLRTKTFGRLGARRSP